MVTTPERRFEVVHTPTFTATAKGMLTEIQLREVETLLATTPDAGAVIPGTDGVRKVRVAMPGRGKRGGARVIYYAYLPGETVYLIFVYAKNDQGNLTPDQKRATRQLVKQIQGD